MSTGTTLIGVHDVQCWVPQSIMEVKTIFFLKINLICSELYLQDILVFFVFVCLLCVKFLVNILFLYITVNLALTLIENPHTLVL